MERPRILVVHYSRTGNTRRVARAVASALAADVEEIRDPTDRSGVLGYLRSGLEAYAGVLAPVERPRRDPARYDVVVVATPVWAASMSSPVRAWLWREAPRLPRVAFLATMGGRGDERTFAQMRTAVGRAPLAALAVRERALARGVPGEEIGAFARAVLAAAGRPQRRRGREGGAPARRGVATVRRGATISG